MKKAAGKIDESCFSLSYSAGLRLTLTLAIIIISFHTLWKYEPYTYGHADPGWMMLATISLAEDFDLDLKNQLDADPARTGGQVSLGKNGEWYPLHEWPIALIALPLYLLIGLNGTLLTNIIISVAITLFTYQLCARYFSPLLAFFSSIICLNSSLLLAYSYSFSVDVLGTCLALWTLLLLSRKRLFSGGIMFSLAVISRNLNAVLLPAYLIFLITANRGNTGYKNIFTFLLGGIPGAILFLSLNYIQFGSPFALAYDSWMIYDEVGKVLVERTHDFKRPALEGLENLLFSPKQSLFTGIPLLLFSLLLGSSMLHRKAPEMLYFFLASTLLLAFTIIPFGDAFPGSFGNRYFMLLAPISTLFLAAGIERFRS